MGPAREMLVIQSGGSSFYAHGKRSIVGDGMLDILGFDIRRYFPRCVKQGLVSVFALVDVLRGKHS